MVQQSRSHHQQLFYLKVEEPIWQYEVQVIIQPGGNLAGITMYLNNNPIIGSGTSLGYTAGFTSVSAPAIFTTPSGITSTLTINVGPYSNTLNTLGLTLAVVALT